MPRLLQWLVNIFSPGGFKPATEETALMAAKHGDFAQVITLVEQGADVNHQDRVYDGNGHSALASYGSLAIDRHNAEALKDLLELGLDPNQKIEGMPLLVMAIQNKNADAVAALISYGADPEISYKRTTALQIVENPQYPIAKITKLLQQTAAEINGEALLPAPKTAAQITAGPRPSQKVLTVIQAVASSICDPEQFRSVGAETRQTLAESFNMAIAAIRQNPVVILNDFSQGESIGADILYKLRSIVDRGQDEGIRKSAIAALGAFVSKSNDTVSPFYALQSLSAMAQMDASPDMRIAALKGIADICTSPDLRELSTGLGNHNIGNIFGKDDFQFYSYTHFALRFCEYVALQDPNAAARSAAGACIVEIAEKSPRDAQMAETTLARVCDVTGKSGNIEKSHAGNLETVRALNQGHISQRAAEIKQLAAGLV